MSQVKLGPALTEFERTTKYKRPELVVTVSYDFLLCEYCIYGNNTDKQY
jgi:hypothetical protein